MRRFLPADFLLRFAGGFALGAVLLIGMQPSSVRAEFAARIHTAAHID